MTNEAARLFYAEGKPSEREIELAEELIAQYNSKPNQKELMVVLGGDGSLSAAAKYQQREGTTLPMLLVSKSKSVAFLADNSVDQLEDCLEAIEQGRFETHEAPMLETMYKGKKYYAFTEVCVDRLSEDSVIGIRFSIRENGIEKRSIGDLCDGAVICTPLGSTAYNYSEKGEILEWGEPKIAINYIAPLHELSKEGTAFSDKYEIKIILKGHNPGKIRLDWIPIEGIEVREGDSVSIKRSELAYEIIRVNPESIQEKIVKRQNKVEGIVGKNEYWSLRDVGRSLI